MKDFKEIIEDIQTNPNINYDEVGEYVQEIVGIHEHMEKRIYDLEHDLKIRDDKLGELKRENFDLSQKITSEKEKKEDKAKEEEEKKISIDDIVQVKEKE